MSDKHISGIPTNEEIINDITKDLEHHCEVTKVNSNTSKPERDVKTKVNNDRDNEEKDFVPVDFSDSDEEEEKPAASDDNVDEGALLKLDTKSTDQQKLDRKQEALELKLVGNEEFKCERYIESIQTYTKALNICPLTYNSDRAVLYCNRAASKSKLQMQQTAVDDCAKAIELNPTYLKAYLRRAKLNEELDKLEESLLDFKKIVELDPLHNDAKAALIRLPPIINEKNEKLKAEMLGKLKDLGNMILRPFGLSTENFNLQQNPDSGGYSINFQQNK